MSLSLQLVELPENEQVASRQISISNAGGTIGRSFDCTVQLPDFDRTLSRVHAEIVLAPKGGYQIIDRSTNGVFVNGRLLGKGGKHELSDGDNIKMGAYTLLVSDIESLFASKDEDLDVLSQSSHSEPDSNQFDVKNLETDRSSFNDGFLQDESDYDAFSVAQNQSRSFSKENVTSQDVFGYDPFDDSQDDIVMKGKVSNSLLDEDSLEYKVDPEMRPIQRVSSNSEVSELQDSVTRLKQIVEQQQSALSSAIAHERLMACLEVSLNKFLEDLHPDHLEEEFNDYISGWGSKDKKYWKLYKKQFIRKKEKGEYYRQFYAILFEEFRGKQ
ncbi:FHA domain-containing protein [Marinomonas sp. 15G1-11]|uniref:FHA domain-containing protein n=1 Tax=Marinomonas phaeophyticola TaxID=3004091 RepID=A0ABT4JRR0_9GAMM|nr:FHA domain-containing protein [Marinomonas sp. 15G1-11]MCZ2720866.1 FHA domain-containing protein [Marinomonas sp. 15G1-11]